MSNSPQHLRCQRCPETSIRQRSPETRQVLRRYSKTVKPVKRPQICSFQYGQIKHTGQGIIFPVARRISTETVDQLVSDYKSGVPTTELTGRYGLAKSSVLKLLADRGVVMRRQGLTDAEMEEAIRLYKQGLSVLDVGERIGRSSTVVWRALKKHGVALRPRNGWE